MSELARILARLAVESAAELAWRCVDVVRDARERLLSADDVRALRAENRRLREQLEAVRRLETYSRRARERTLS